MWGIVGLGNPGPKYSGTRHNAGFIVLDRLALSLGVRFSERKLYMSGKGQVSGTDAALIKPLTFMNNSGAAVREAFRRFGITPEELIVVHDDLDMEAGRLKVKSGGGPGGHKGLISIMEAIGTGEFARVKIGIGRDDRIAAEKYVLARFAREELPYIDEAAGNAVEAIETIIASGITQAMNLFNRRPGPAKNPP